MTESDARDHKLVRMIMTLELESMAVEMPEVKGHPNRTEFEGVLTVVDVPSERSPHGAMGRRVLLSRKAAEDALPSLVGMGVDYTPSLDGHDVQRKVGVITRAEVVGRNLEVGGYLYAKDFPEIVGEIGRLGGKNGPRTSGVGPRLSAFGKVSNPRAEGARLRVALTEAVKEIRSVLASAAKRDDHSKVQLALRAEVATDLSAGARARSTGLGMSFEVTNVNVLDERARIWTLTHVTFTGAAILRKDKAAYRDTWIELCK
jgi:hypothetical protein